MRRDFANREELATYIREQFPDAAAVDPAISSIVGGRAPAEERLAAVDPPQYARSRNHIGGAVTQLSPYLRHGVLSLAEVRDTALGKVRRSNDAYKFINELGWRDYWQRVYAELGDGIWKDREPYKTGFTAREYAEDLPDDVRDGTTGLACMDGFAHQLRAEGYLHNHMRMWLAAYIVHWRRVRWQAGARWFLQHLLDGDPASNNLSWQWVASTFSHKPYVFNRDNLERYTDAVYCRDCPLNRNCPLDRSYAELEIELFPNRESSTDTRDTGQNQRHR
jgi:deoxyribodipyrimidine photo-lyase